MRIEITTVLTIRPKYQNMSAELCPDRTTQSLTTPEDWLVAINDIQPKHQLTNTATYGQPYRVLSNRDLKLWTQVHSDQACLSLAIA